MDEYIGREAALDIVNDWRNQLIPIYGENDEYVKCLETVAEHLESLHATDVQPVVRGRWNNIIQGIIPSGQCSNCGAWDKVTRFCPNCGAQMEGET